MPQDYTALLGGMAGTGMGVVGAGGGGGGGGGYSGEINDKKVNQSRADQKVTMDFAIQPGGGGAGARGVNINFAGASSSAAGGAGVLNPLAGLAPKSKTLVLIVGAVALVIVAFLFKRT